MSGFLDYLKDFDSKIIHKEDIQKSIKTMIKSSNKNILSINSEEIDSVEKAKLLIEKIQNWISKQEKIVEKKESTKNVTYRIPPKKFIKSSLHETISHAMDILDGITDEQVINPIVSEQNNNNINNLNNPQVLQQNLETVSGHASALL